MREREREREQEKEEESWSDRKRKIGREGGKCGKKLGLQHKCQKEGERGRWIHRDIQEPIPKISLKKTHATTAYPPLCTTKVTLTMSYWYIPCQRYKCPTRDVFLYPGTRLAKCIGLVIPVLLIAKFKSTRY